MAKPLNIVIVGGSLSGLMSGIALKHAGHHVTIFELGENQRESHMAGVCLGRDAEEWLLRHDRLTSPFYIDCTGVQVLRSNVNAMYVHGRRAITSWDVFYFRLRANFDGYVSKYYAITPPACATDGPAIYKSRSRVVGVTGQPSGEGVIVAVEDQDSHKVKEVQADYVIAADGPNSFIRSLYLPQCQRRYAGNIAWRGTVPEAEISTETVSVFENNVTISLMNKHHCLVYIIPGEDGSLVPGRRMLNFLWYTNETAETLAEIMVDAHDGTRHHNLVPAGHVRKDVWDARLLQADVLPLAPPFLEVIHKIQRPFIQCITEFCASKASFEGGRVLLVGDGLSLYRPHTAFSGTQAAFHALRAEEYIRGQINLSSFEEKMCRFSKLHWAQSEWWGKFYQSSWPVAAAAVFRYWWYCGIDMLKSWWYNEERLLRGFGPGQTAPRSDNVH